MKFFFSLAFAAVVFVSAAADERADKGGFTFDFKAATEARFKAESGAINLVEGLEDWKGGTYCYMHNKNIPKTDPRHKEVRKAVEWKKEGGELVIVKKPELVKICGDVQTAANVSGGFTRTVRLPDANGGTYRVSFSYRMRHEDAIGRYGCLILTPIRSTNAAAMQDELDPHAGTKPNVYHIEDLWTEDALFSKDVLIAPGFDSVKLVIRISGVGELRASDITMTRQRFDVPVTVQFSPAGYIDGTFAFSSGQCGLMCVQWRRNDETEYRRGTFEYELTLPRGYTLIEAVMADPKDIVREPGADGATIYRMKANGYGGGVPPREFINLFMGMLIRAEDGAREGVATFAARCNGRLVSNVAQVKVFTIPRIQVAAPKRYCNGFYRGGQYGSFRTAAAREGFADLFTSAGATWVAAAYEKPDVYDLWRRKGVRVITPGFSWCANGFVINDGKTPPPDDQKFMTPKQDSRHALSICPTAVYEEKSYFRETFVPWLTKNLEGADGLWANWEPFSFEGRGCFCDSCCREFAAWMKVPYEEVRKDWPMCLKMGGKYHGKIAQKFRSWQHGRLIKTINKHVIAATGGEKSLGFIPGVSHALMSSLNLTPETQPIDYAGELRWIDPWGPYPWWRASTPYVENPSDLLRYWCSAKDVREQVDMDYAAGARPKLMAMPHGFQLNDAICQPEGVSLALDSFFFNGWDSAVVYAFPKGSDARWWRAFAEATARAAKYEDAVLDGVRVDAKVSLTPEPGYPAPARDVDKKFRIKTAQEASYLQCAAYDHGGRRICAVINYAYTATARFTLKAEGLPPGRYEVVSEDGVVCAGGGAFTERELAECGVKLVVPALRTRVFELRPL